MRHLKTPHEFNDLSESFNVSDDNESKILYKVEINGDIYQLLEVKETEFTDGELIMVVYKNDEEIDIDEELDNLLKQFRTLKLTDENIYKAKRL